MDNILTRTVFGKSLDKTLTLRDALKMLNEMNLIDIGELAEQAVSKKSKVSRQPKNYPGSDLVNDVEIKYGTSHRTLKKRSKTESNYAWISKKNKSTVIAAIVTETASNKEYFFLIPHSGFKNYKGNALPVHFTVDGTPCRESRKTRAIFNIWDYEVSSYSRLCKRISEIG